MVGQCIYGKLSLGAFHRCIDPPPGALASIFPAGLKLLWAELVKCLLSHQNLPETTRYELFVHDKRLVDLYIALQSPASSPMPIMPGPMTTGPADDGRWDGDKHRAPVSA